MFPVVFPLALVLTFLAGSAALFGLRGQRLSIQLVGVIGAIWTAGCSLYVACLGVFLFTLLEPWPYSLRQGPDTDYAREGYERVFGAPPPSSVAALYCREEWGFGGDGIDSLRFTFRDPGVVQGLVERLDLEPVPADRIEGLRYLAAPAWWPAESDLDNSNEAYQRSGVDFLWIDRETGRACFQRANF